jgi:hypothetical protein
MALDVNTTLTQLGLRWNKSGEGEGQAMGNAIQVPSSLAEILLCIECELVPSSKRRTNATAHSQ